MNLLLPILPIFWVFRPDPNDPFTMTCTFWPNDGFWEGAQIVIEIIIPDKYPYVTSRHTVLLSLLVLSVSSSDYVDAHTTIPTILRREPWNPVDNHNTHTPHMHAYLHMHTYVHINTSTGTSRRSSTARRGCTVRPSRRLGRSARTLSTGGWAAGGAPRWTSPPVSTRCSPTFTI